jgi:hypothetical protein
MVNYQDAKIYKLVGGGFTYYGSTCSELRYRLYKHKHKNNTCKSKLLFDTGDKVEIILVEKFPCEDKMELHKRERYFIENFECVNKCIPNMTRKETKKKYRDKTKDKMKEYYEENRETILKYKKEYRENNKEKIKDYHKLYYEKNKTKIEQK